MSLICSAYVAVAQESLRNGANLTAVIEQAKRDDVRVVIVEPDTQTAQQKSTPSPPLLVQAQTTVQEVKDRFLKTLVAVPIYWDLTLQALQVTNYLREWVVMKLPLRLTYDTDAEMVRKLIKKLGKEMMKAPILGPLFCSR